MVAILAVPLPSYYIPAHFFAAPIHYISLISGSVAQSRYCNPIPFRERDGSIGMMTTVTDCGCLSACGKVCGMNKLSFVGIVGGSEQTYQP